MTGIPKEQRMKQYIFVANKEKSVSMFPTTTEPAALFLQEK